MFQEPNLQTSRLIRPSPPTSGKKPLPSHVALPDGPTTVEGGGVRGPPLVLAEAGVAHVHLLASGCARIVVFFMVVKWSKGFYSPDALPDGNPPPLPEGSAGLGTGDERSSCISIYGNAFFTLLHSFVIDYFAHNVETSMQQACISIYGNAFFTF